MCSASPGIIGGVTVYVGRDAERQVGTVWFNVAGTAPSAVGLRLVEGHVVLCRVALDCSLAAHKTIGTFPEGTVDFGLSAFSTLQEIEVAVEAVWDTAKEAP